MRPRTSVIIIFLNEARFLEEAIASVFAQTCPDWELLLVDDGSSDGSEAIARRWAAAHPEQVRYLTHPGRENRGMSASRRLGVQQARGDYIAFLDGDDVWLPQKLAEQTAIMQQHPAVDLVCGPLQMWYSWSGRPEDRNADYLYGVRPDGHYPLQGQVVPPPRWLALFLKHEEYIPSGFLARQTLFNNGQVYEPAFRGAYSDAVALVQICLRATLFIAPQAWYRYRKHDDSNTYLSWLHGLDRQEQLDYLNWVEAYLQRAGVNDPAVWKALRQVLYPYRHPRRHQWRRQGRRLLRRRAPRLYRWLWVRRHGPPLITP